MLDGLDKIDWKSLWHFQPEYSARIPQWIRDLTSESESRRSDAKVYLFGEGTEYGKVTSATPYIIPFLVELLGLENTPEKSALLGGLSEISFGYVCDDMPIGSAKDSIASYEAVASGLPIYLRLLKNEEMWCRYYIVELLGRLTDTNQNIIPFLIEQFMIETEAMIQYRIVENISNLSTYTFQKLSYIDTLEFLKRCLKFNDKRIQVSAAIGLIQNRWIADSLRNDDTLFSQVMINLRESFFEYPGPWTESVKQKIIFQLTRLDRVFSLDLLSDKRLSTPQDAHMIVHYLLHSAFEIRGNPKYSHYYINTRSESDGITYSFRANFRVGFTGSIAQQFIDKGIMSSEQIPNLDFYKLLDTALEKTGGMFPEHLLTLEQKRILQSILKCEPFWQLRTNLFSFFYGLPDNRDVLRKLISES